MTDNRTSNTPRWEMPPKHLTLIPPAWQSYRINVIPSASILFLEKSFLKQTRNVVSRGVELFDLQLIQELLSRGYRVTLPIVSAWEPSVRKELAATAVRLVRVPNLGHPMLNGLWSAVTTGRHDVLVLGNVANGLIPAIQWLFRARKVPRATLIANREASPRFVKALRPFPLHVVAVNGVIAERFRRAGYPAVAVSGGVLNAELFHPRSQPKPAPEPVNFCVVGQLDNAWKGADTAIAAYQQLPDESRRNSRLHLASFLHPPAINDPNIVIYPWMATAHHTPEFLRRMDVMLVPSRDEVVMRETFSAAMVQGMLTGLAQVVSDLPILKEKLEHGGGLVFHNVNELTQHMAQLIADAALRQRLGAEARQTALRQYVWNMDQFIREHVFPTG